MIFPAEMNSGLASACTRVMNVMQVIKVRVLCIITPAVNIRVFVIPVNKLMIIGNILSQSVSTYSVIKKLTKSKRVKCLCNLQDVQWTLST